MNTWCDAQAVTLAFAQGPAVFRSGLGVTQRQAGDVFWQTYAYAAKRLCREAGVELDDGWDWMCTWVPVAARVLPCTPVICLCVTCLFSCTLIGRPC
jgi:hypothetical protein